MTWGKRARAWERRLEEARVDELRCTLMKKRRPRSVQVAVDVELRKAAKRSRRATRVRERLECESATLAARREIGKALLASLKDHVSSRARTVLADLRREPPSESIVVSSDVVRSGVRRRAQESFMNRRAGGQPTQCGTSAW